MYFVQFCDSHGLPGVQSTEGYKVAQQTCQRTHIAIANLTGRPNGKLHVLVKSWTSRSIRDGSDEIRVLTLAQTDQFGFRKVERVRRTTGSTRERGARRRTGSPKVKGAKRKTSSSREKRARKRTDSPKVKKVRRTREA